MDKNEREKKQKREIKNDSTLTAWLLKTIGASAIAGICEMSGSCDGEAVYRNLQR
ncbi:hypothetical protein [Brotaphodocola sp.]|uniref:hypothetical protein n=1 Tax=Brotaphodocola sp. TaxID=3073577 RepID=UPI003D7CC187